MFVGLDFNFWETWNPQGKVLINYSSTRLVEMMNHIFEIWEHYEYRRPPIENLGLFHLLEGWYKTYIVSAAGEKMDGEMISANFKIAEKWHEFCSLYSWHPGIATFIIVLDYIANR